MFICYKWFGLIASLLKQRYGAWPEEDRRSDHVYIKINNVQQALGNFASKEIYGLLVTRTKVDLK